MQVVASYAGRVIVDLYARVSLDRTGESLSVDNQVESCREYAAKQGWTVGTVYSDNSISATKGKHREGFEAVLSRHPVRPVLVHNTDRLVRTMKDLERVLETGTTVHAVIAGTMDLATSQGRMVARLLTSVAQNEGELKAERMMLSYAARAARGETMWRVDPVGHDRHGKVTEWAPYVSQAVDSILAGKSMRSIAADWNSAGVPTTRYAKGWTGSSVREAVENPRIAGVLMFKGERMSVSQIEPIVSEAKYDELMGFITNPSRTSKGPKVLSNLLSGLALCGRCRDGSTVTATYAETIGGWGPVYRCRRGHNQHPRVEADSHVLGSVLNMLKANPVALEDGSNAEANAEVLRLLGQLSKWQDVAGSMEPAEYLSVTSGLRDELIAARAASRSQGLVDLLRGLDGVNLQDDLRFFEWWESTGLMRQRAVVEHLLTVTLVPRQRFSPGQYEDYVLREAK